MQIRNIDWPRERNAILEFIRVVFGPGDSEMLAMSYGTIPGFNPADCFLVEDDAHQIVAHAMLIPRYLQFGTSILNASEVGMVGSLEAYRHQGLASALVDRLLERANEREDAMTLLFGQPTFFGRWGFEYGIGMYLTTYESEIDTKLALNAGRWNFDLIPQRRMAEYLGIRRRAMTIRPFTLSDLPVIMNMYAQSAARGYSIIARNEETWLWQINYMEDIGRSDTNSFLVAEAEGQILGYIRMVIGSSINWVHDNGARFSIIECGGDDPDANDMLLAEAAAYARDFDTPKIGLFIHPRSTLMAHALAHGAYQRGFTSAGLIRLNDLELTLAAMRNAFEDRLATSQFADYCFKLQVASETHNAEIEVGNGKTRLDPILLEAPANDLIRLLSGWYGVGNLTQGSYALRYETLLNVLFPKGDPKIGLADVI